MCRSSRQTLQGPTTRPGRGAARGFRVHASLAVTPARVPLGVLHAETWARTGPTCSDLNRRHIRAGSKTGIVAVGSCRTGMRRAARGDTGASRRGQRRRQLRLIRRTEGRAGALRHPTRAQPSPTIPMDSSPNSIASSRAETRCFATTSSSRSERSTRGFKSSAVMLGAA